jgi:hypothetical protein
MRGGGGGLAPTPHAFSDIAVGGGGGGGVVVIEQVEARRTHYGGQVKKSRSCFATQKIHTSHNT